MFSAQTSANTNFTMIKSVCQKSPFDCIAKADDFLQTVSPKSRIFFDVLQYKYEALFNLQYDQQLYDETKQWINNEQLPVLFQITNAIYFAKTAIAMGDKQASKAQYLKAKQLLEQLNEQYPSPIRLVQFANLQMVLKEHQQAYELLLSLTQKYQHSPDSHFMLELFGNLGHVTDKLGKHEEAVSYWLKAITWSEVYGNTQQIAVVRFNIANSYMQLKQYQEAAEHYEKALELALTAQDIVKANMARFRLVQVLIEQDKLCHAKQLFEQINEEVLASRAEFKQPTALTKVRDCQPN
ncbi:tetratricopeptide repeat protein [Thalassotalea sp. G2M2-11]|uniref:tetratricopeptide repeat protein n=1 Tax=Thalassotalea sp. G2M2-11 TaxID=2787627 RepID=UPI0019D0B27F|nr:tetratricopeptide repeat protein [Thalassotalea sp. G2M2-11]